MGPSKLYTVLCMKVHTVTAIIQVMIILLYNDEVVYHTCKLYTVLCMKVHTVTAIIQVMIILL